MNQSAKIDALKQSEIRNMSIECDKVNGINLSQGVCDLPLPDLLKRAVNEGVEAGYNHYTRYDGIDQIRMAIAKKAQEFNHITCDYTKQVCVSCGATGALYCTCYSLFDEGDEVILFEPYYGYHEYTLFSLNLKPIYVKLRFPTWDFLIDDLEACVTNRTRAILINTPSNPCGKVFTENELEELADFAIRHNLIILTDEIYEYITFDNRRHMSPASIDRIKDRTVTISGYSKTFSITGWRIGYSIASPEITESIGIVNDLIYVCAPSILQYAVSKAINSLDESFYQGLRQGYQTKRDMLCETLTDVGLTPTVPQGAYYVLADVSPIPGTNSKEKAMWILNNTGVGVVPGGAFFKNSLDGNNLVRFCFAKSMNTIQEACNLLLANSKKWR